MKKNIILAVALFALIGVSAFAQDAESDFQVTKSADGKSVTITKYVGTKTAVNIPAKIQNLPVTVIGSQAFQMQGRIISVIIPEGVTSIKTQAFRSCNALESIIIPSSVNDIQSEAFAACPVLKSVTFQGSNNIGAIGAFSGDLQAKYTAGRQGTYTREGNVWTKQGATATAAPATTGTAGLAFTPIKNGAEYSVNKGTVKEGAVVIPASYNNKPVTLIESQAFEMLDITSVTIPNSITIIMGNAFHWCRELTSVTFQGTVPSSPPGIFIDNAFDGDLYAKFYATDKTKGTPGTYIRSGTFQTAVWTIQGTATNTAPTQSGDPENDFQVTKTGNAITITKYVGTKTTVNIPSSIQNTPVTTIGGNAFVDKAAITAVTIPASVTSIGDGAFARTGLTSITIPNGVTIIGGNVFLDCAKLTSVTLGSGITNIGDGAFARTAITSITLPSNLTSIAKNLFLSCAKLTTVTIGNKVASIGEGAFVNCTALNSVTFTGTIPLAAVHANTFPGDLRAKFYATDKDKGTPGTYTSSDGKTWTKK